jgi:hypothetical protein
VEVGKLVITMTTKNKFKKEKTMAVKHGKAKGGQKGGQYGLPQLFNRTRPRVVCWTFGGPCMKKTAQIRAKHLYQNSHI